MRRLALLSLLALAACAGDPGWVNPNLPKSQASGDYGRCRREAEQAVGGSFAGPPDDDRNSNPMRMAAREDDQRHFAAYMDVCMRALGYFPKN